MKTVKSRLFPQLKNLITIGCLFLVSCRNDRADKCSFIPWDMHLSVEQNIARNATAFEENDSFPFLSKIVEKNNIIILGEEGHYDLTTTEIKTKMVTHLKRHGVRSLALEVAPFLTSYVFSKTAYAEETKNWKIEDFWSSLWTSQATSKPLIDMINRREIRIFGIDSYLGKHDIASVQILLNKFSAFEQPNINWREFEDLYVRHFVNYSVPDNKPLSVKEQFQLMRTIDSISNHTFFLISKKGETDDLSAILQWIRNINVHFSYIKYTHTTDENETALVFRNRDIQMAENIAWIYNNYPKEKLIVWCANFHAIKDISQTQYPTDSLLYFGYQCMGEALYSQVGNQMYALAFTSLNTYNKEKGGLEQEIARSTGDTPFAFIDFKCLRLADGYRDQEFDCNVIMKKKGKWLYMFDGLYYIRDQKIVNTIKAM